MFVIDDRIMTSSTIIDDWPLSTVILKNEKAVPWLILVPRVENARELMDLSQDEQYQLSLEMAALSKLIKQTFDCDKLNIATLGNIVPQLHIHVVARTKTDPYWPESIWQSAYVSNAYDDNTFITLQKKLQDLVKDTVFE